MPPPAKKTDATLGLHLVRAGGGLSDAELLDGVLAHDESVADAFARRVWPTVTATVRRLLGDDTADADDVAQVAVIEALAGARRFRRQSSLDGWVRTIAAHTVYKHVRRRGLERKLFTALADAETEPARSLGPANALRVRGAAAKVLEHLGHLDADRATAWVLHDVHGYDLKEISVITQVSEAAAQTRLSRGRRELLERLSGDRVLAELLTELEGDAS